MTTPLTLLLPEWSAQHGRFSAEWLRRLGRARCTPAGPWIVDADTVRVSAAKWPVVQAGYRADTGEQPAADSIWLRLDPATAAPDLNGVRMLAFGPMLQIRDRERDALRDALAPLFAEQGMQLHWPLPARAYLQVPVGTVLPVFSATAEVLGDDLLEHLPRDAAGPPSAALWRRLLTDVQIDLHAHPVNAQRLQRGLPKINLLWPWQPEADVVTQLALPSTNRLRTPDDDFRAVWQWAGGLAEPRPENAAALSLTEPLLLDLRDVRRCSQLEREWLDPLLQQRRGSLELEMAGRHFAIRPHDRFKFWRGPLNVE